MLAASRCAWLRSRASAPLQDRPGQLRDGISEGGSENRLAGRCQVPGSGVPRTWIARLRLTGSGSPCCPGNMAKLDPEPLVQTFAEAVAHWRQGVRAHLVLDLEIPTGPKSEPKPAEPLPPGLDDSLPF